MPKNSTANISIIRYKLILIFKVNNTMYTYSLICCKIKPAEKDPKKQNVHESRNKRQITYFISTILMLSTLKALKKHCFTKIQINILKHPFRVDIKRWFIGRNGLMV